MKRSRKARGPLYSTAVFLLVGFGWSPLASAQDSSPPAWSPIATHRPVHQAPTKRQWLSPSVTVPKPKPELEKKKRQEPKPFSPPADVLPLPAPTLGQQSPAAKKSSPQVARFIAPNATKRAKRSRPVPDFERRLETEGWVQPVQPTGYYEPGYHEGSGCHDECGCEVPYEEPGCGCDALGCADGCEPGCGCESCDRCESCGDYGCGESCETVTLRIPKFQEMTIFGGVQGFKGPLDQNRDGGNFGFHEGFNLGAKLPTANLGYQIGYQAVHSQLDGDATTGNSHSHTQQFFTAGLFHRTNEGLQYGVVWDSLRDERVETASFRQIRGEVSMVGRRRGEIGFMFATSTNDRTLGGILFQTADQYLLFYRLNSPNGGAGRLYGGFTDDDDGILGGDILVPLHDRWSLQTNFAYLIPNNDNGILGAQQEAWNLSMHLVWHWKTRNRQCHSNPYRPLFDVADNGWLIVDDRP